MENNETQSHKDILSTYRPTVEDFRKLVDASPAMLWTTEPDGKCTYLSKKWTEYTGRHHKGDLGFGWVDAIHPDDRTKAGETFLQANQDQRKFYIEYRLRRYDGEYRWAIDQADPHFDQQGNYLGFVGMVLDIHDKKMAEQKLLEAIRARDEFLSIASHELKTPLTSLKLQSQIFSRSASKGVESIYERSHIHQLIDQTNNQVNRLNRLVDDMLDVSRIRTGRLTLIKESFDLCELTTEILERLREQFANAHYEFPTIVLCKHAHGEWDKMRIEQVIINLLTNAIRYGMGKPIHIAIEADDNTVRFTIEDKGMGIDHKDREKIFHRFERAISANEISGLGLGLFISKQIILAHKGEIWVESMLGNGSTFIFELPK